MRGKVLWITCICVSSLVACNPVHTKIEENHKEHHTGNQHQIQMSEENIIYEETKNLKILPKFLSSVKNPNIKKAYLTMAKQHSDLQYIPCFCGCGKSDNHQHNRDCFIKEIQKNGEIIWSSHAITCYNCVKIALQTATLKEQGKSLKEIRKQIDFMYKTFPNSTPTPMPPDHL